MDNSDLMQKVAIRHNALKALGRRPELVLDMFAGEGKITNMFWAANADSVICIEKDEKKATNITGACSVIVGDNLNYIYLSESADIIDCDAYGRVMPLIEMLPKNKLVVFTDGSLYASKKNYSLAAKFVKDTKRLFSYCEYSESRGATAYYGWGITR